MRASDLKTILKASIRNGRPVLITGAPGIGKSDVVKQACGETDSDLILSHPVVADPTDAKGLPWISKDQESAQFLPFGDLHQAITATKQTVWFLDDLGQASPAVQASYMQLLLARRVNNHVLPDCVTFIAATNRRTDRAGVTGILEPVKSRFPTIVELTPHLDDWCAWAQDNNIPGGEEVCGFLRLRSDLLSNFQPTADLTQSPMPRTWAHAGQIVADKEIPRTLEYETLAGAVGDGAATEFVAYLEQRRAMPDLDAVMNDPEKAPIPNNNPALLYAITTGLAYRASVENFQAIAIYTQRLHEKQKSEFAAFLLKDTLRRVPQVTETQAFIKLASKPVGRLIIGGRS